MAVRTEMAKAGIGKTLEHGIAWGLSASPLFMAMLMVLSVTPSSLPTRKANLLYLVCMAGVLAGCAVFVLSRRFDASSRMRRACCCLAGAALELAWFVLIFGRRSDSVSLTACGMFLVGVSTAILLVLWLCVDQATSPAGGLVKYATALTSAFVFYSLFGIAPGISLISFLFAPAACIPLLLRLNKTGGGDGSPSVGSPGGAPSPLPIGARGKRTGNTARNALASTMLVAFGAGLAMLGYGGQQSEYGAGLTALMLVFVLALSRKVDISRLVGQLAAPLVVVSLCYASLYETGTPFALLLAGCGAYVCWALVSFRRDCDGALAPLTWRSAALLLAWATLCVACGLGLESLLAFVVGIDYKIQGIALVGIIVAADLAWRIVVLRVGIRAVPTFEPSQATRIPTEQIARKLGEAYGLSARESQVAAMLYDNRSSQYICTTLDLAPSTVKTHIRHIYEKTGAHSRADLQLLFGELANTYSNEPPLNASGASPAD